MKFGYTIVYVADVNASLAFFGKAFGLKTRFSHESGYGELDTGETTLAFATHDLGRNNLPAGYVAGTHRPSRWGSRSLWLLLLLPKHTLMPWPQAPSPSKSQCSSHGGKPYLISDVQTGHWWSYALQSPPKRILWLPKKAYRVIGHAQGMRQFRRFAGP